MVLQEDYQVTLDAFHGPLDLLLYLVRRAEVDIHDIPVAAITDQYVALLRELRDIDIDEAGEFLVMAATLMEIKSRTLMPPGPPGEGSAVESATDASGTADRDDGGLDPRYELVQQLLAYQAFRIASEELEHRRLEFARRFPLRPGRADREERADGAGDDAGIVEIELEDVHAFDLFEAYESIMSSIDFTKLGDHRVEVDDTPIELHAEDLLDRLTREPDRRVTLLETFRGRSRGQRLGMFLALLELVRMRRVTVVQDDADDDIVVELNDDPQVLPTVDDEFDHLVFESLQPGWHHEEEPPAAPEAEERTE